LFEHLGNAAEAKSLYPSFMQRIVANFEQRGKGRAPTSTPRSSRLRRERAAELASASLSMILKYDQTIRENTMSANGLYNSRSELIREHAAEAASGLQKGPAK
jgi:hypothetical protein